MSTPTPRTDAAFNLRRIVTPELVEFARTLERELAIELERATHYRDHWQKERAKVQTLRSAMKFIANDDNYMEPYFDPCQLASSALAATEETK